MKITDLTFSSYESAPDELQLASVSDGALITYKKAERMQEMSDEDIAEVTKYVRKIQKIARKYADDAVVTIVTNERKGTYNLCINSWEHPSVKYKRQSMKRQRG